MISTVWILSVGLVVQFIVDGNKRAKAEYIEDIEKFFTHSIMSAPWATHPDWARKVNTMKADQPEFFIEREAMRAGFAAYLKSNYKRAFKSIGMPDFKRVSRRELKILKHLGDAWLKNKFEPFAKLSKSEKAKVTKAILWLQDWSKERKDRDIELYRAQVEHDAKQALKTDLREICPDEEALISWLEGHGSDPALWHDIVIGTDPDGRANLYDWIARQPDCDKGTAIQIFHHCAGYEVLNFADLDDLEARGSYRAHQYRVAAYVANRIADGGYTIWRFAANDVHLFSDLKGHLELAEKTRAEHGRVIAAVTPDLFDASERETPETDYIYTDF